MLSSASAFGEVFQPGKGSELTSKHMLTLVLRKQTIIIKKRTQNAVLPFALHFVRILMLKPRFLDGFLQSGHQLATALYRREVGDIEGGEVVNRVVEEEG
jgi:hypothetical protein